MIIFFVDRNHKNIILSEILDIKKLEDVDKPIEGANGLPNACYISNDYFAYERGKNFRQVIGSARDVPDPNKNSDRTGYIENVFNPN